MFDIRIIAPKNIFYPSRFKQFSVADADMRRRLFWAIYSLERYLSQSLGLPLDIKDDDVDVCYSDKELHADDVGGVQNVQQPHGTYPGAGADIY